jgi:hypothetical protein
MPALGHKRHFRGGCRDGKFAVFGADFFVAGKCDFTEGKNEKNSNPNLIDFGA